LRRSSRPTPSTASSLGTCSATPPSGLCYHICYFDFVGQVGLKSRDFVDLWHRALAAATASFIHLAGPGRFYFTGHNAHWIELPTLRAHLESMVKMTPLQSFSLEVLPPDDETALLGAGVSALRAL